MPAYRYCPPQRSTGDRWAGFLAMVCITATVAALVYYLVVNPWVRLGFVASLLFIAALNYQFSRRLKQVAESRPNDSICTFARAFDYRQIDTWIIRAVYEQLQTQGIAVGSRPFPLHPEDHLSEDFGIVGEDFDDLAQEIATRTGRSWKNCQRNPYYGNVETVRDLVMFFSHQPKEN